MTFVLILQEYSLVIPSLSGPCLGASYKLYVEIVFLHSNQSNATIPDLSLIVLRWTEY